MSLPPFALKDHQAGTLAALRRFLEATVGFGKASTAFREATNRPYHEPPQLPGLPYVCLRVPTGGGKTILAAHAVGVAADAYLRTDAPTVLWFVPSQTIRDQTLAGLQDRAHPYRRALAERFGENVRVMGVADALYARRADYDGGLVVIVATIQGFRVEETEGRKVYEANGELMDHFGGLAAPLRARLEAGPAGDPLPSLANLLKLRRPMVIVDEAHNVRTRRSFETLARLDPSLIVEFTATPELNHDPGRETYASNVLHHVSAAELKAADMIKLPVILRGRPDPRDTIADAIAQLDELAAAAAAEESETGEYLRPVMLVQAEARSATRTTLHPEEVRKLLIEDFRVPPGHVALATGDAREIDGVDLFDRACPIRFVITQQALREGWDCSFAYVLCSVAEQRSARAVEQLLGRVLRLPRAKRKRREALNRAYAFATTTSFQNAAQTLRDGLVANGFERVEAQALVRTAPDAFPELEPGGAAVLQEEAIPFELDAAAFKANVESATGGRVVVDLEKGVLRARGALSDYDRTAMLLAMPEAAARAVDALVHKSRGARLRPVEPAAEAIRFAVPRLGVRAGDRLELFDRAHFLDMPWKLEEDDPAAILDHFAPPQAAGDGAVINVSAAGQVTLDFVADLHAQLALALAERGWTRGGLINWLDRHLPGPARRDITRVSSTLFIARALDAVEARFGLGAEGLARAKFRLVEALIKTIARHRDAREAAAFRDLFGQSGLDFQTSADIELVFDESRYAYSQLYRGGTTFKKHLFRVIGDLESSGEEFDCAVHLERSAAIEAWVRNTARQPHSFWLQTSSDRFYPDFVARTQDGRSAAVEYKGAHLAGGRDAEEKRLVGELWAERSGGACVFVMVEDREFGRIDAALA